MEKLENGNYVCPSCNGNRKSVCFVNTGVDSSKHYAEERDCDRCKGAGEVSEAILIAIEQGKAFRKDRVARGLTMLEAAEEKGVSVATISKMELGYLPVNLESIQDFDLEARIAKAERVKAHSRKTAAFREWQLRLKRGDTLPRGKYFKGKSAGGFCFYFDECGYYFNPDMNDILGKSIIKCQ